MKHDFPQYSDNFWRMRNGKPSASCAGRLVTPTGKESTQLSDYATELAGDMYAGQSLNQFNGNAFTDRGTELEEEARLDYSMTNQVSVEEIGMFSDSLQRWIASPDGCVGKDGLVEIKVLKPVNHIKALIEYNETGKVPSTYIPQLQMQLLISGRKWNDLFLYNPDLPSLTIRQYPDKAFFTVLRRQLKKVITERNLILEKLKSIGEIQ